MMKDKAILKVAEPPMTTFPSVAATLGILTNHEESLDWCYSNYIQLYTLEIVNRYEIAPDFYYVPYIAVFFADIDTRRCATAFCDYFFFRGDTCPYLEIFEIPNDFVYSLGEPFSLTIKRLIDLDMYIFANLDTTKIAEYKYHPQPFHEVFIYGYDDTTKEICFADFLISQSLKYSHSKCSFDEINNAFIGMKDASMPPIKSFAAIRYTEKTPYIFDFSYVRDTVIEYVEPDREKADKFNAYAMTCFTDSYFKTKAYFGIDVYDFFVNHIDEELAHGKMHYTIEAFHGLYDHKEMMIKRIERFIDKGYMDRAKYTLVDEYRAVRDNAMSIRNIIIKYNMQKKEDLLDKAKNLLRTTKEMETELLKRIFDL